MSKVEDRMPVPEERSIKDWNWIVETTRKVVINRSTSKCEDSKTNPVIFKKYGSG